MTPPTTAAPTTELGTLQRGSNWAQPVLDEAETNRDLTWPRSIATYRKMLNDAQIEGLYKGATLPIRGYRYYLEPNGARPEVVARISADYGLPIGRDGTINQRRTQRRFIFDDHLEDALRAIAYGHFPFEQVFEVRQDGPAGINGGWLAHVRKLAPRPPSTIIEIRPARDGGLDYIKVPALNPARAGLDLTGAKLTVDRLLFYVWDREGANWRGRSMLRSCYRPWKLKDRVLRVGAINIERAGGVPYVEAPEGASRKQMEELHALAAAFRVGESAGAALPHGAQLKFASAQGGDQAISYVRLMNEEAARAWLMMFLQSGQTSSGHGSTEQVAEQIDYFALVQEAIAGWFCDIFNRHQIEDDVEYNEGPGEEYAPLVCFEPQGDPLDALAGALDDAQTAGALPADSQVAAAVRRDRPRARRRSASTPTPSAAATRRRELFAHEVRAATDFDAMDSDWQDALAALLDDWGNVTQAQIDELVAQAAAAGSIEDLAGIQADTSGADRLAAALADMANQGRQLALDEARAQGVTIDSPDLDEAALEQRATAVDSLLAKSLSEAAGRRAVNVAGEQLDAEAVAGQVRDHLESLTGAHLEQELGAALTQAQNTGRATVFREADPESLYASALLDANTCGACAANDGEEYSSVEEAERDFPAGQYVGCEGGNRCRCVVVAVYPEA